MNTFESFYRRIAIVAVLAFGLVLPGAARAALYTFNSGTLNQAIPDNNPAGSAYAFTFSETGITIASVSVTLNLSGGWNGDVYAYLSHGSQMAVLLNRVGGSASDPYGSGSSGFNITLNMGTDNDIHAATAAVGSPISGSDYTADGRISYTDPPEQRDHLLDVFAGEDADGSWSLFFADQSPGGISTLNDWTVRIMPVPEPVSSALIIFGGLLLAAGVVRKLRAKAARVWAWHQALNTWLDAV